MNLRKGVPSTNIFGQFQGECRHRPKKQVPCAIPSSNRQRFHRDEAHMEQYCSNLLKL